MMLSVLQRQIYIWKQHVIERKLCMCSFFCLQFCFLFLIVFFTFVGRNSQLKQCLSSNIIHSVLLPHARFQVLHPLHALALNFLQKARGKRKHLKRSVRTIHSYEEDYRAVATVFWQGLCPLKTFCSWTARCWQHSSSLTLLHMERKFPRICHFLHSHYISPRLHFHWASGAVTTGTPLYDRENSFYMPSFPIIRLKTQQNTSEQLP